MTVRQATPQDGEAIRDVVERSMLASYSLAPGTIEAAVSEWFGDDPLGTKLVEEDHRVLVAVRDDAVVGVADVAVVPETETGDLRWLHVDPDYRGEGIGRSLYDASVEWLEDRGAGTIRGLVLANNADGNRFYRERGFERVGEREVDVDGTPHTEHVYRDRGRDGVTAVADEGREVYVDASDPSRGSLGAFYTVYADAECTERYGYQCGHCSALATAMDSMGRIECGDCANTRKPTRWDAAYL